MIQAIRETNFEAFVNVYDTRISNRNITYVRHLFKFINDLGVNHLEIKSGETK